MKISKKISVYALLVIGLLLFRAFFNYAIPLMDKTEARYSEIARIMAETNDFTTLQIDYGVPFWAKPPLSTWLTALSFKWFGVNEFTARLPYLLLNILVILLIGRYAERKKIDFFIPAVILLTIPEFLIHTGVVSTDTALAFSVTLVMISFWEALNNKSNKLWKYLFFVGLGLGLLAKGPIIFVLTAPPIFIWCVLFKKFKTIWKVFPWVLGTLLVAIIAIPWYYLAEQKTPGFLDYFIVGEHFKRYLSSGWKGDKYGFPKSQPLGMVWVFLAVFALPWIQATVGKIWKNKTHVFKDKWLAFLILWLLWTPLFFTVSKSLIHPYIMPVMVPIALLITHWWNDIRKKKMLLKIGMILPVTVLLLFIFISFSGKKEFYANSDKYLIENNVTENVPVFHWQSKSYSGQFYTKGKMDVIENNKRLKTRINSGEPFMVIIPNKRIKLIDSLHLKQLTKIGANYKKGIYLFKK